MYIKNDSCGCHLPELHHKNAQIRKKQYTVYEINCTVKMYFIKGMIYPKPHPQVVWVSFTRWTQNKLFWRMLVTKQVTVKHWLPQFGKTNVLSSQWLPSILWKPTFFKTYYFVFSRKKKRIRVWNNWIAFWGENIPLTKIKSILYLKY